ncbi:MAG TPA: cupin domain-containing protein [Hyphomicrobiaceae bacterium]|nr:cupin domain-containing protein [Hyphomicrobiaceae bacterium]
MTEERAGFSPVRRVVTGHDERHVAKVIRDDFAENRRSSRPEVTSTLIWSSDEMPADIRIGAAVEDMGARKLPTQPPPNGSRFIVMEFLPGASGQMHRTDTLDYISVLEGEIEMDMDDTTVRLKAGDVMVQRGTNHAWKNRSTRKARLAIVLLDAKPLGIGTPRK